MLVDICRHPTETILVIGPVCRLHDVLPWSTTRMRTRRPLTSLADLRRRRRVGQNAAIQDLGACGIMIPHSKKNLFAYDSEDGELTKLAARSMSASLTRPPSWRVLRQT